MPRREQVGLSTHSHLTPNAFAAAVLDRPAAVVRAAHNHARMRPCKHDTGDGRRVQRKLTRERNDGAQRACRRGTPSGHLELGRAEMRERAKEAV
jgi:hypothetical protein